MVRRPLAAILDFTENSKFFFHQFHEKIRETLFTFLSITVPNCYQFDDFLQKNPIYNFVKKFVKFCLHLSYIHFDDFLTEKNVEKIVKLCLHLADLLSF